MRYARMIAALAGASCVTGVLSAALVLAHAGVQPPNQERVIKIVAQRFRYNPKEIEVRKGQPVVLEFTALDFVHGFKIPDLAIRADLPPGKVVRIRITPAKEGVYDFLCDNFCGAGHEEMSGRILVKD